jgi:hypothetical protein
MRNHIEQTILSLAIKNNNNMDTEVEYSDSPVTGYLYYVQFDSKE